MESGRIVDASTEPHAARDATARLTGPDGVMIYRERRGVRMPALGFGTFRLQGSECTEAVRHALELGYRHIDTAAEYGNEAAVGRALRESGVARADLFLTTKVWWEDWDRDATVASATASLERLETDYVDLLLLHWPHPDRPLDEPLAGMDELRERGKARWLGVSNFTPSLLDDARPLAPVVANQVEYHPFLDQEPLLAELRRLDMLLIAHTPLARGTVADEPTLRRIARRYDKTPSQIALRWHMQQDRVVAIPKAANARHREDNMAIFDFALSDGEMVEIFALARGTRLVDPAFAPAWRR